MTIPWQPHHCLLYFCQGYYVQSNNSSTKSIYNLSIVSGWLEKNCFLSVTMATTVPYIEISVIVAVSQKIFLERTKRRQKNSDFVLYIIWIVRSFFPQQNSVNSRMLNFWEIFCFKRHVHCKKGSEGKVMFNEFIFFMLFTWSLPRPNIILCIKGENYASISRTERRLKHLTIANSIAPFMHSTRVCNVKENSKNRFYPTTCCRSIFSVKIAKKSDSFEIHFL